MTQGTSRLTWGSRDPARPAHLPDSL